MKILLLSLILITPNLGFTADGKLGEPFLDLLTNMIADIGNKFMECAQDVVASAQAQARIKESFARQRVAGLAPHADITTIETSLRLAFRANSGLLKSGETWRAYPTGEAYTSRAKSIAEALEEHVAGLKQIRTWGCTYDDKVSLLIKNSLGPLSISGKAGLTAQAAPPPYTEMERAYRFGPIPVIKEAKPVKDEKSALWLDWAAAGETDGLIFKMKRESVSTETKKETPLLAPDQIRIKETLRLWALAAAAENNSPAPKLSEKRLDMETALVVRIIQERYGSASSKELNECRFDDFISDIIGKAAKRLLIAPAKPEKEKPGKIIGQ